MAVQCLNFGGPGNQQLDSIPKNASPVDPETELGKVAKVVGAKVFVTPDGKAIGAFRLGKTTQYWQFQSVEHAESVLGRIYDGQSAQARALRKGAQAGKERKLEVPEAPVDWSELDPTLRIQNLMQGGEYALLGEPEVYLTGYRSVPVHRFLPIKVSEGISTVASLTTGPKTALDRLGPLGQKFTSMIQDFLDVHGAARGRLMAHLDETLRTVSREDEVSGLFRANAAKTLTDAQREVYQKLRRPADVQYATAQALRLEVAPQLDDYWPSVLNPRRLVDPEYEKNMANALVKNGVARNLEDAARILADRQFGTSRETAISTLIAVNKARGHEITRAEAQNILERVVKQNHTYFSGHLERERLSDLPPIENARVSWGIAYERNARRLAEAQVFGPNHEKAYALIDQIGKEHGERAASEARKVFNMTVGLVENEELPAFLRHLYDWQGLKLTLSALPNLSQNLNTAMRAGLRNLLKGAVGFAVEDLPRFAQGTTSREAIARMGEHAQAVGAMANYTLHEIRHGGIGALLPEGTTLIQKFVNMGTAIFSFTETLNRSIAVRAGEHYFMDQVARLARNPADKLARTRLLELRLKPDVVLNASPDDLTAMKYLAGKRISDESQFTSTTLTRPLWAQSPYGKFMFQFKQFATNQGRFIAREIMAYRRGDLPRTLRTLGVLTTLVPAFAYGITEIRRSLMGKTISSDLLDDFFKDPSALNLIGATVGLVATVGALGIAADMAMVAYQGNKLALANFVTPPTASSMLNALSIGSHVLHGIAGEDREYSKAIKVFLQGELGGVGAITASGLERRGILETSPRTGLKGLRGLKGL